MTQGGRPSAPTHCPEGSRGLILSCEFCILASSQAGFGKWPKEEMPIMISHSYLGQK